MTHETRSTDTAAAPAQPAADHLGAEAKYCTEVLHDLVEMARELARMVIAEVHAQTARAASVGDAAATPAQDGTVAFDRIARTIRRTVMLSDKLAEPKKKSPSAQRVLARRKIIRDVEDAIQHKAPPDQQEALHAELMERLDRPDLEEEIAHRPIGDIVNDVTRDLGLSGLYDAHPWKRRIPHDIAILNARAEQPAGAGPSEKLLALLAAAPPPLPRRMPYVDDGRHLDEAAVRKMSDEEIEIRLERLKRWT